jgi:chromosome segregation ATPase
MNFVLNNIVQVNKNDLDLIEEKNKNLETENKELRTTNEKLKNDYYEKINKKELEANEISKKFIDCQENLKKYRDSLDQVFSENLSQVKDQEKVIIIQQNLQKRFEIEKQEWLKEKEDILNSLKKSEERVKQLEENNESKNITLEQLENSSKNSQLQNKIHKLNRLLMNEKRERKEAEIESEIIQNNLKKANEDRYNLEDNVRKLNEEVKKLEAEVFKYKKSWRVIHPNNIQRVILGGTKLLDPRN